jgi:tRNA pseudouridine38-40 synthase
VARRAFRLAYDGRPYHGFQRQPDVPTVEGTLLEALLELGVVGEPDDGSPPSTAPTPAGYAAAGRTDAGVSAVAQTVAFDCPDWCTPRALNGALPGTVRAWAAADAPPGFHATHDATRRAYVYHLYGPDLDDEPARRAAHRLSGEHDYRNLTADDRGTVRDLAVTVERDGSFLAVRVAADGFARELVRRLVSLVRAVAAGEASLGKVARVLGPDRIEGPEGVPAAPPTPLVLVGVDYPGLSFATDPEAAASARAVFDEQRVEGLVVARVAERVLDGLDAVDGPDGDGLDGVDGPDGDGPSGAD